MVLGEKRQDVNGNMDQGCESKTTSEDIVIECLRNTESQ